MYFNLLVLLQEPRHAPFFSNSDAVKSFACHFMCWWHSGLELLAAWHMFEMWAS